MGWNNLLQADFYGDRHWVLTKPLSYTCQNFMDNTERNLWKGIGVDIVLNKNANTITITVPNGYHTDLASIHRVAWSLISPWDVARGAVLHDMLYGNIRKNKNRLNKQRIKNLRLQADQLFKRGMIDAWPRVPKWKIVICYNFVRCLGWASIIKAAKFEDNDKSKRT